MQKIAIVTGGSSGIGLAIAQRLLDDGFMVCNLDLVKGPTGKYYCCDITDRDSVQSNIDEIAQQGDIKVLVSNAGVHYSANIENTSAEDFQRVMDINVKGAYHVVQAVLPYMKHQSYGSIVLISSDQALIGKKNSFVYNLSKAALASIAKTTALDYAEYNIRANAVCPGTIETPLYHQAIENYCQRSGADMAEVHAEEASMQPLGRLGKAEEVAALVSLLAGDDATFITGSLQVIDGGYTAQ